RARDRARAPGRAPRARRAPHGRPASPRAGDLPHRLHDRDPSGRPDRRARRRPRAPGAGDAAAPVGLCRTRRRRAPAHALTGLAAHEKAGPGLILSFVVAGIGCAFAGLCYAEFASMVPVAGSAYTYAYATLGELFAWIIGWDLVLEYAVASSTVAHGWSHY